MRGQVDFFQRGVAGSVLAGGGRPEWEQRDLSPKRRPRNEDAHSRRAKKVTCPYSEGAPYGGRGALVLFSAWGGAGFSVGVGSTP